MKWCSLKSQRFKLFHSWVSNRVMEAQIFSLRTTSRWRHSIYYSEVRTAHHTNSCKIVGLD
jgi:hypothetical protein